MKGRKPTPTNLRVLRGNPARRPLPKQEPQVESGYLIAPPGVSEDVARMWAVIAPQLAAAGISTELDRLALRALCESYCTWEAACEGVRAGGLLITPTDGDGNATGAARRNPCLGIAHQAFQQYTRLLAEFGMTPSSRARVQAAPAKEDVIERELFGD